MVNVARLKKGDILKVLTPDEGMGLNTGDIITVFSTGFSHWDDSHYADCKTDKGYTIEVMKNFRDFELI